MFLMVISTEPYLLIDDLRGSPFNVGQTLFLDDFAEPEVSELNRRYGSPLTEADTHELFELVGGHPFLTRVALYTLVKDRPTWKELAANSLSDRGLFGEHLAHQHRLIAQDSKLRKALKEIMQRGRGADEIACHRLLKAGLIKRQEGDYVSRNNLYRRYLRDRL